MPSMREMRPSTSTSGCVGSRPMPSMRREKLIAPPVAIIVFDGMQSHRCAAPPMTSRSITVTLAPSLAAYVAAVFPAGPPPTMTKRMVTPTGYGAGSWSWSIAGASVTNSTDRELPAATASRRRLAQVRAVGRRIAQLVAPLTHPLEVHPVGHEEVAAPREVVAAEDAHDLAVHLRHASLAVADRVRVERHRPTSAATGSRAHRRSG